MPGTQDHVAEREHNPDPARGREPDHLRESRAQPTDLQARLERLPVGHPSSPYRDDGSRKPPAPDLAQYELPLPDELPHDAKQSDPDLPTEDSARISPDGSRDWKGRLFTPEASRAADEGLAKCRDAEGRDSYGNYSDHGITPAMRRIEAQLEHGHLIEGTEAFALKEPDRFKEKLARLIRDEPDSDPAEILSRINDGVRYTFIYAEEQYSSGVMEVCAALADGGFELYERKNAWVDETKAYQGVNSSWMDHESEQLFEVQIHTPTSWRAKQEGHLAYEIIQGPSSTPEERAAAAQLQEHVFGEVSIPPDARDIPSFRKEGW